MKKLFAVLCAGCVIFFAGCSDMPGNSGGGLSESTGFENISFNAAPTDSVIPAAAEIAEYIDGGVIPQAAQSPRVEGDRITYTVNNVYSQGEYYAVNISGVKCSDQSAEPTLETTYVDGVLYGDFRLDLLQNGQRIGSLKINVPRDDRFMILDSAADNRTYGCALLSNKREFAAGEFPDIIQLDFYIHSEGEVPQYARYFAVFDSKLAEIPVYENGEECAPYGTNPQMKSAGLLTQHLTVSTENGSYKIVKYEYSFDVENRRLVREEVKFYGWEN
ncbi:MAG: hypothetical protein J1F09_07145 [Oscillospiraceae bacterium]|nr:hypothetical protein [Oscillospiraceae bacterium]